MPGTELQIRAKHDLGDSENKPKSKFVENIERLAETIDKKLAGINVESRGALAGAVSREFIEQMDLKFAEKVVDFARDATARAEGMGVDVSEGFGIHSGVDERGAQTDSKMAIFADEKRGLIIALSEGKNVSEDIEGVSFYNITPDGIMGYIRPGDENPTLLSLATLPGRQGESNDKSPEAALVKCIKELKSPQTVFTPPLAL